MSHALSCQRVMEALAEHLAGGGIAPADRALEAHLRRCPSCRREAERLRTVVAAVRHAPVPEPGESYWQAFPARVRAGVEAARRRRAWRGTLWGSAAAAAVLAGLLWFPRAPLLPAPSTTGTAGGSGPAPMETGLEGTLDSLLGWHDPLDLEVRDLTPDERQSLIESLRAAMKDPA
ncbi:MAG: anti-sigma factor family protein [Acidobacteriota bacterium]